MSVFPNPFTDLVQVQLQLSESTMVQAEVFNTLGQKVAKLVETALESGTHTISWDGKTTTGQEVLPGLYVLRIAKDGVIYNHKLIKQ
jgi:flagellar hook assembly protein FlgD